MRYLRLLLVLAAILPPWVYAPDTPGKVLVRVEDSRGEKYEAYAQVTRDRSVNVPVNGESAIPLAVYRLTFVGKDGKERTAYTTESLMQTYSNLASYYARKPNQTVAVPRNTGGYSPGVVEEPFMDVITASAGRMVTDVGVQTVFKDFKRVTDSHGDPALGREGKFETVSYSKMLRLERWVGGTPRFQGGASAYEFPKEPDLDPRQQRFLLDFGKHPFNKEKQLLHPVYVDRFEGDDAIVIAPSDLQKLERAREGEKVKVAYWVVPRNILRLALPGAQGDELLQSARSRFVNDQGEIAARGLPIETIFRANRHQADKMVEFSAGASIQGTMLGFRTEVSKTRGSLRDCGLEKLSSGSNSSASSSP